MNAYNHYYLHNYTLTILCSHTRRRSLTPGLSPTVVVGATSSVCGFFSPPLIPVIRVSARAFAVLRPLGSGVNIIFKW